MKTINMYIYPQNETFKVNTEHFDDMGSLTKFDDQTHIVEHIYEFILPIVETHANDTAIYVYMNRRRLDISDIEQSYYDFVGE